MDQGAARGEPGTACPAPERFRASPIPLAVHKTKGGRRIGNLVGLDFHPDFDGTVVPDRLVEDAHPDEQLGHRPKLLQQLARVPGHLLKPTPAVRRGDPQEVREIAPLHGPQERLQGILRRVQARPLRLRSRHVIRRQHIGRVPVSARDERAMDGTATNAFSTPQPSLCLLCASLITARANVL